jgi:hypothetical protein
VNWTSQVDRPSSCRGEVIAMRLGRLIFNIELATGRVRPTGGQGTARSTISLQGGSAAPHWHLQDCSIYPARGPADSSVGRKSR